MRAPREVQRSGVHYLSAVTALLQRGRSMHPTKGLYEAAEVQWWWARPRSTDDVAQLFWFDGRGRPEAAVIITDWRDWYLMDDFAERMRMQQQAIQYHDGQRGDLNVLGIPTDANAGSRLDRREPGSGG